MVEDVDLTPKTWGWKKCHLFAILKWINSDFYKDQKAGSSPFCSEHTALTDEIFKRQEERDPDKEKGGNETRKTQSSFGTRQTLRAPDAKGKYKLCVIRALEVGPGDWELGSCGTRSPKREWDLEQSQASCLMPEADGLLLDGPVASDEAVQRGDKGRG